MNSTLFARAQRTTLVSALLLLAAGLPGLAPAAPIAKMVNINVYQVCTDDGSSCASQGPAGDFYYEAETNKIWAQAGISVTFSFVSQVFSTQYYNISDAPGDSFIDLYQSVLGQSPGSSNVDMFLVNDYDGAYGVGFSGLGGLVMSMLTIMDFDCGGAVGCIGRIDTLAHELGHNLGLTADSDPDFNPADPGHSIDPNNLMAAGDYRNVPTSMADINPDGFGLDKLSQFQIDYARNSALLRNVMGVPEPGSLALVTFGLLGMAAARRRVASGSSTA